MFLERVHALSVLSSMTVRQCTRFSSQSIFATIYISNTVCLVAGGSLCKFLAGKDAACDRLRPRIRC